MRRTLILTLAVLACALAVCGLSQATLNGAVEDARQLRAQALLAENGGDAERAGALLSQLAQLWQDRAGLLEKLASHDALHDVAAAIAEAKICLECRDHDDFLRTMSTVEMGLSHLTDEEALRWDRAIAYCISITINYIYITKRNSIGECQSNQRGDYDDESRDEDAIGAIGGGTRA